MKNAVRYYSIMMRYFVLSMVLFHCIYGVEKIYFRVYGGSNNIMNNWPQTMNTFIYSYSIISWILFWPCIAIGCVMVWMLVSKRNASMSFLKRTDVLILFFGAAWWLVLFSWKIDLMG